MTNIRKYEHKP